MNNFQRRHYKAMVSVIRTFDIVDRVKFVAALHDMFKADNAKYDSHKFFTACAVATYVDENGKWLTTDDNYFKGLETWNMTVKDARKLEHAASINVRKAT